MDKLQAWVQAEKLYVSRESWERIATFVELLLQWQNKTNLISPATIPDLWGRHVLDSLQLLPLLPHPLSAFADLGSGSGFPALPLAIATDAHVHLVESNGKKAAFLRDALRVTGAKGTVHATRLEQLVAADFSSIQAVTARALAPLDVLLGWAAPLLSPDVHGFFHKGQDFNTELTDASKSWRIKFRKHQSLTDSRAVILEIEEVARV